MPFPSLDVVVALAAIGATFRREIVNSVDCMQAVVRGDVERRHLVRFVGVLVTVVDVRGSVNLAVAFDCLSMGNSVDLACMYVRPPRFDRS